MTDKDALRKALEVLNAHCLSEAGEERDCRDCYLIGFCAHMAENYYGTLAQAVSHFEEVHK